ncbi:MAG: ROK family protein, partial [Clostridia bacterium]|nr:ROK family protein [Clostridia bacterium]
MYRVGIDIGGTKMNVGILDGENNTAISKKVYIKDISDITVAVKTTLEELCGSIGITLGELASVGIGIPGTVSDDGKKILKAPNISILSEDVAIRIENALGIPAALVQDSRAAAWGEYLCGGGKGSNTVVCVTLGTGIGTGIVLDGKIYNGALGSAGELGHIPVCENGRPCGCGKNGCLEKYCAGGGLDITAAELLGEGKTAADLFDEAKSGNEKAKEKIFEAVTMLGGALVSIINLISPDCLLLSGGLSAQEELYVNPLIDYIKEHCYSSGKMPVIKKAELGENAPMVGAALVPNAPKRKKILSASIMCADIMNFGKAI